MKNDLKQRWATEPAKAFIESLCRLAHSGNGYELKETPFGTVQGTERLDFRGIVFPDRTELRRVTVSNADFSSARIKLGRLTLCSFVNVCFDQSLMQNLYEYGNDFKECSFRETNLGDAILGYHGSRYTSCYFEATHFRKAGFIRAEFDDCLFDDCTFGKVDFSSSSFERCVFRGQVRDVWFRGTYPVSETLEQFANPRPNLMSHVSFKDAQLLDVTFSDHCDLSTVIPPSDGRQAVFDCWPERIRLVFEQSRSWAEPCRKEGGIFLQIFEGHAKKQDWYLIGVDALVNLFGVECGTKIWEALIATKIERLTPLN